MDCFITGQRRFTKTFIRTILISILVLQMIVHNEASTCAFMNVCINCVPHMTNVAMFPVTCSILDFFITIMYDLYKSDCMSIYSLKIKNVPSFKICFCQQIILFCRFYLSCANAFFIYATAEISVHLMESGTM
jgi:hypothetical protein